jgi:hypothetical protein
VRDSFFDPVFMVALKAYPEGTLTLVILERVTQTLLSIVVGIDVTLVALSDNRLWVTSVVCIQRPHVSAIT